MARGVYGQEVHYYMVYFAYFTELKMQNCDYVQKRRICCKKVNTRLTKIFMAIFALAERVPTSATLLLLTSLAREYLNI